MEVWYIGREPLYTIQATAYALSIRFDSFRFSRKIIIYERISFCSF